MTTETAWFTLAGVALASLTVVPILVRTSLRRLRGPRFLRVVGEWWGEFSPGLRRATALLWSVGIAFTLLGLYGDLHGFWAARPFATNLVSSLTGGSFGIPIALLVIQQLAGQQNLYSERREQ